MEGRLNIAQGMDMSAIRMSTDCKRFIHFTLNNIMERLLLIDNFRTRRQVKLQ